MSGAVTKWGKADPFRWELTNQIAAVLHANGSGIRSFYNGKPKLPKVELRHYVDQVPFDGVRAEVGGTTVSIEITTDRQGDLSTADQMRFACYDFESFRTWFYNLLRRAGQHPLPDQPINLLDGHFRSVSVTLVKPAATLIRPSLHSSRPTKKR